MTGRGAWPNSGAGGTLAAKGDKPGPYYVLNTGEMSRVGTNGGWESEDPNVRAVRGGVLAIQRALNRRLGQDTVKVDGRFGPATKEAVIAFQKEVAAQVGPADGIVGPKTMKALLLPDLRVRCNRLRFTHWPVVCGIVTNESNWDPGAVGGTDEDDLGLAQINGPSHPEMDERERLSPSVAFDFVIAYLENALKSLDGNLRDAIASYNLGIGGARKWIAAGRPDMWSPAEGYRERNVKAYIDRILTACSG